MTTGHRVAKYEFQSKLYNYYVNGGRKWLSLYLMKRRFISYERKTISPKTKMLENNRIELLNYNQTLGELQSVYRVELNVWYFFPHLGLLFVFLLGLGLFLSSGDGLRKYLSILAFAILSLPFLWAVWFTLRSTRDELRIYEKGFTYKSRKGLQSCLWNEIKDVGGELDTDNCSKLTSVIKDSGEKISLAYKMQGRDVLDRRYMEEFFRQNREELETHPTEIPIQQTLGELQNTYHVKKGIAYFFPAGLVLFLFLFGILTFIASKDILWLFVCATPLFVLFCALAGSLFSERKDELKVYKNGFTYKSRKEFQNCFWDEIEDYTTVRRGSELTGVKKENGDWINFANEMQGLDELNPLSRKVIKWNEGE